MKKIDNVKETYRLWWEYLKQSKRYKKFCECVEPSCVIIYHNRRRPSLWANKFSLLSDDFVYKIDPSKGFTVSNCKTYSKAGDVYVYNMRQRFELYYNIYGDVYIKSFKEWWQRNENIIRRRHEKRNTAKKGIMKYSLEWEKEDLERFISNRKEISNQKELEPSLRDYINYIDGIRQLDKKYPKQHIEDKGEIHLIVCPKGKTVKELQDELGRIIRERRKEPDIKSYDEDKSFPAATILTAAEIEGIKRYLKIYKLKKSKNNKGWKDICKRLKIKNKNFKNVSKDLMRDFRKAEYIMDNVEKGTFPGVYQDNKI